MTENTENTEEPKYTPKLYHYLITIQGRDVVGMERRGTYSNVICWDKTRQDAFNHLLGMACERSLIDPRNAFVMAWSFEPNDIS